MEQIARPGALEPSQDASLTLQYIAPPGVTLADCTKPTFWRNNVAACARARTPGRNPWNKIEIIAEDGTWEALLRIVNAADGLVTTRVLWSWSEPAKPGRKPSVPEGYTVEYIASNGWRALNVDGVIIADRLPVEEQAVRAAADHAKRAKGGD